MSKKTQVALLVLIVLIVAVIAIALYSNAVISDIPLDDILATAQAAHR